MGEIADMILDGVLCQVCGEIMEGGDGIPQTCSGCRGKRQARLPKSLWKGIDDVRGAGKQLSAMQKWLEQFGLTVTKHNGGQHWKFECNGKHFADWWPSTYRLKFHGANTSYYSSSVKETKRILELRIFWGGGVSGAD